MKIVKLDNPKKIEKNIAPKSEEPNINTDCYFVDEKDNIIGFYLEKAPERLRKIATLTNNELLTNNVPKSEMGRVWYDENKQKHSLKQFSTIIGAVRPEIFKRRYKPGLSHVHLQKKAEKYIKLMYLFAKECEILIKKLTPNLYEEQKKVLQNQKIKIGNLWTSSIANYNTAAKTHIDGANIIGANNIIYFKRENAKGGHLCLPEYGAVINSQNDALVFYPAYRNIHGVTEIEPTKIGGYRNSLVLYPLNIKY